MCLGWPRVDVTGQWNPVVRRSAALSAHGLVAPGYRTTAMIMPVAAQRRLMAGGALVSILKGEVGGPSVLDQSYSD